MDTECLEDASSECSEESVEVVEVIEHTLVENYLHYLVIDSDGAEHLLDRSELCDCGPRWKLLKAYEKSHTLPWDEYCELCDDEGCEECICFDCERPTNRINQINYGCPLHPVV